MNTPRDHHYVPQFFLRNFAVDPEAKKITTVAKHGQRAVWATRSIESLGFERDLYVHLQSGIPISVETSINERIENPISKSDTWAKITSGRTDELDRSDKPILYALIRHLEVRTPHYMATAQELAELAASPTNTIAFTEEEREMYAEMRSSPEVAKAHFNAMSATLEWTENNFRGAGLSIFRSPIPLRSSTTPVLVLPAPSHPSLYLPLPGMTPFQLILTLSKTTIASLVLGDFDDAFNNIEIGSEIAKGFNRHFVGQFAFFDHVRHLITDRQNLADDMTWAPYRMIEESERKITFQRRS
ncbi:MAG: DUF4238 domain-containing protein [Pseudolabrys sp.]